MSTIPILTTRSLLAAWLVLFAASAGAQAIDDDDEPVGGFVPQQPLYLWNEALFNRAVFGNTSADKIRAKLEALLHLKALSVERTCGLSGTQKERLLLAGRGDIERLFDRIDDRKGPLGQAVDQKEYMRLQQELQPLRLALLGNPFGDGSYFAKALKAMLQEGQRRQLGGDESEAGRRRHLATIDHAIVTLDAALGLSADQRRRLRGLLAEEIPPPAVSGAYNTQVVLYHMANLPADRLRPIFDESQWDAAQRRLAQARALKPVLVRAGYLADDATPAPAAPAARPGFSGHER